MKPIYIDVMLDLETLGRRAGCAILSIGAVAFNSEGLGSEFYHVVNHQSCLDAGLHVDPETAEWWQQQSDEAKKVLRESMHYGLPLYFALGTFTAWLDQFGLSKVRIWGNGSDFDQPILSAAYAAVNVAQPWMFWNNRCYRTLKNLNPAVKLQRQGTYHNALDDAKSQALHAIELLSSMKERAA